MVSFPFLRCQEISQRIINKMRFRDNYRWDQAKNCHEILQTFEPKQKRVWVSIFGFGLGLEMLLLY